MKCVLSASNAKVFAKAVQSLGKIGSELFIEATSEGLSIRTANDSKSAFTSFKFFPNFFMDYDLETESDEEDFHNKCKVSVKASLGVFKNMKQVEHCEIKIEGDKLVVKFKCRLETLKTHFISILDIETLQAVYVTDTVPNKLTASHKLFAEISSNFQTNEEEITLEAACDNLTVKNYVDGSHVDRRFMRSQLNLKSDEFDKYSIKEATSITFCLREFRALLAFAEATNLDMLLCFEKAGLPVVFVIQSALSYEANLVMSTLSPDDITMYENSQNLGNSTMYDISSASMTQKRPKKTTERSKSPKKTKLSSKTEKETTNNDFSLRSIDVGLIDAVKGRPSTEHNPHTVLSAVHDNTIHIATNSSGVNVTFQNTAEEIQANEDSVPKSPTLTRRTRARKVFKRCFEATFNPPTMNSTEILARSSDTED